MTPYAFSDQLFLKVEQILPLKEAEEFAIRMAEKTQEDISSQETLKARHHIRLDFWSQFIKKCNKVTPILQNVSPSKDNWIGTGIGLTGVGLNLVVSRSYARTEIYINRGSQEENKEAFDFIKKFKDEIEPNFQDIPLIWERMDDKVTCRIKHQLDNVSIFNKEDWPKMTEFMIDSTMRMEKAFKRIVKKLGTHLKK